MNMYEIKKEARKLKNKLGIRYTDALNRISCEYGFKNFQALKASISSVDEDSWMDTLLKNHEKQPSEPPLISHTEAMKVLTQCFPHNKYGKNFHISDSDMWKETTKEEVEKKPTLKGIIEWYINYEKKRSYNICGCMGAMEGMPLCPCLMNGVLSIHNVFMMPAVMDNKFVLKVFYDIDKSFILSVGFYDGEYVLIS